MAIPNMAMIPSGYKPTRLYSVLPTPSYGSEEVTNGDFSNGSTDWILDSGWSVANGKATNDGVANGFLRTQDSGVFVNGTTYIVSIKVSDMTMGEVSLPYDGGGATYVSSNGVHSMTYTPDDTNKCWLYAQGGFNGSIDNISVKEAFVSDADFDVSRASSATRVNAQGLIETPEFILSDELITNGDFDTDSDWFKGSGWTISGGKANSDGTINQNITQSNVFTIGKSYKVDFTISDVVGSLDARIWMATGGGKINVNANGEYTTYWEADGTGLAITSLSGNAATYSIDNISVVQVEREDIPRLDYTDGGCPVLLTEPQSTNLITHSEDFSDSSWLKGDSSVVGGFSSPSADSALGAFKLIPNTNNSVHKLKMALSTSVSGIYTYSVFCKKGEYKNILVWDDTLGGGIGVNLDDLSIFRDENNQGYKLEDYGNGWIRVSIVLSYSSQLRAPSLYIYDDLGSVTFQGDGTSGVYIFGAQLEQLSYATSYMPTYGAISTRASETINNAGDVNTFNSTEGTLFVEISADNINTFKNISINNNGISNRINLYIYNSNVIVNFDVNGSNQSNMSYTLPNVSDFNKIAFSYKLNEFKLFVNGVQRGSTDTSGSTFPIGTLNNLSFNDGNASKFYGKTKNIQVFNTALSDSELQILTSL